jgi:hypothetical protein
METVARMPWKAKIHVAAVVAAGLLTLAVAAWQWECQDPARFTVYVLLAIAASVMKVKVPGMSGTYSLNFLFVLIGIAELSFSETAALGGVAALVQSVWKSAKRPQPIQVLFNISNYAVSIAAASAVFGLARHQLGGAALAAPLSLAAFVFFVSNVSLVSTTLALVEQESVVRVSGRWIVYSFPYYLLGTAVAGVITLSSQYLDWRSSLLFLPLMYLVYFCYRSYMQGLARSR